MSAAKRKRAPVAAPAAPARVLSPEEQAAERVDGMVRYAAMRLEVARSDYRSAAESLALDCRRFSERVERGIAAEYVAPHDAPRPERFTEATAALRAAYEHFKMVVYVHPEYPAARAVIDLLTTMMGHRQ